MKIKTDIDSLRNWNKHYSVYKTNLSKEEMDEMMKKCLNS